MTIKNHFHINGFALNLALKVRLFGTRKWPIVKGVMISCKQVVNKFQGDHKSWIPVKISVIVLLAIPVLLLVWHAQCLSFSFLDKPRRYSL